jgi:hypothetical protein
LKVSGSDGAFNEVIHWSNKLFEFAKTQQSYSLLIETYLLQSQLALLELDIQKAQNLLFQAELITSEKKLGKFAQRIAEEQESLHNNLSLWEKLIGQKATMTELIELANLDDILERMLKKRIYSKKARSFRVCDASPSTCPINSEILIG